MNEQIAVRFEMLQTRALLGHGKTGLVLTKDMLQAVCNLCYANRLLFLSLKYMEEDVSDFLFTTRVWDMDTMEKYDAGVKAYGDFMYYTFGKKTINVIDRDTSLDYDEDLFNIMTYGNQTIPRVQTEKDIGDIANVTLFKNNTQVMWQGINDPPVHEIFGRRTGPKGLFYSIVGDYKTEGDEKYRIFQALIEKTGTPGLVSVTLCKLSNDNIFVAMGDYFYVFNFHEKWVMRSAKRDPIVHNSGLVQLRDGNVLVLGGADDSKTPVASAYVYDPETMECVASAQMPVALESPICTCLHNGTVYVLPCSAKDFIPPRVEPCEHYYAAYYPDINEFSEPVKIEADVDMFTDSVYVFPQIE